MVSDPMLQWVLTIAFSATGLYALMRITVDSKPLMLIGNLLHLAMSVGMVTMCWPWWSVIPAVPQLFLYGAATVWFAVLPVLPVARRDPRGALGEHSPWHHAAHAIMMLAMAWMTVSMNTSHNPSGSSHHLGDLPLWASLSGVALTAALLVVGAVFLVELFMCLKGRTTWLGHSGDVAAGAVMSLGMAAMCWPMIVG